MRIAIVCANTVEFDSRLRRTAAALADDGHRVTLVGFAAPHLPDHEPLFGRSDVDIVRVHVDRRIATAFRPLPEPARAAVARLFRIDPQVTVLPPVAARGWRRIGAIARRFIEIVAIVRRSGLWTREIVRAVPDAVVWQGQALMALPVVRAAARRTHGRFVYDMADLHTEAARIARMPGWFRRLVRDREAGWVREAAAVTAASDAMADEGVRWFRIPRPVVLLNTPVAWRPDEVLPQVPDRLRPAAGLDPDRPVILYQGGFSEDRGLEAFVGALDEAPLRDRAVTAVFLGYGRLDAWLRAEAARRPGRLVILDAVPPDDLPDWTASATLGYVGIPPSTLNHQLTLANKLFEFVMAGLPVVVSEDTEHCRLVRAEGLGTCADVNSAASVATALAALLDLPPAELVERRRHAREVALARYSWEVRRGVLLDLYRRLATGESPNLARP